MYLGSGIHTAYVGNELHINKFNWFGHVKKMSYYGDKPANPRNYVDMHGSHLKCSDGSCLPLPVVYNKKRKRENYIALSLSLE
jgi:hypothetical protein